MGGMVSDLNGEVKRLADSTYFRVLGGLAIFAVTVIGPPIAYGVWTSVASIQETMKQSRETLVLLNQRLELSLQSASEARIALREGLKEVKEDLKEKTANRYDETDAKRDFGILSARIDAHRNQLTDHNQRIFELEKARITGVKRQ